MTNSKTVKEIFHTKEVKKQSKIEQALKEEAAGLRKQYTQKTLSLITGSFGVVAGLAWNEVVKEVINIYVKPFFGEESGLVSLFIYAVIITALVVFVSFNLSKLEPSEKKEDKKIK